MKENHTPAISEDDSGLGLKVHEDAYRELEEEAERYRLEANAMMMQRDRLAEALRELCETLLADKPRDITDLLNKAGDALAAAKL
jgi:hypothetical protein